MSGLGTVVLAEPEPTPWLRLLFEVAAYGAAIAAAGALAGGGAALAVAVALPLVVDWVAS